MIILHNNLVTASTTSIDSLTEIPTNEFSVALKDTRSQRQGITVDDTAQTITFDLGSAQAVSYFCAINTNISSSATITISGNSSDSWASPAVTATPVKHGDTLIVPISGTYRYWQLAIDDPTNPDGVIKIGLVYLGGYVSCPGMERNQKIPRVSTSISQRSTLGGLYGDRRLQYRKFTVGFSNVSQSEKVLLDGVFSVNDIDTPMIVLIWEDDLDIELPMYANLTGPLDWARVDDQGLYWTVSLTFEECF